MKITLVSSHCLTSVMVHTQLTAPMLVLEASNDVCLSGAIPIYDAYFGEGSGPIHFHYVHCYGTEYNLTDCETANNTRETTHSEDVGVQCQPGSSIHNVNSMHISIVQKALY